MKIKAALLTAPPASGKGVFVRIDELEESALTENHLREIAECDRPPNEYVWRNGTFVHLAALERRSRPDFDLAFAGLCGAVEALGAKLPEQTRSYLSYLGKRHARRNSRKGEKG